MVKYKIALASIAIAAASHAWAAPVTIQSESLNATGVTTQALAARQQLLGQLTSSVQTFGFESALIGTGDGAPLDVNFASSSATPITATLNGSGTVAPSNGGRFDTTSNGTGRFWQTRAGGPGGSTGDSFYIDFSSPIAAFGFYATDVGDFDGAIKLLLTPSAGGPDVEVSLNNSTGSTANQSLMFFGFYDKSATYSRITFTSSGKTSTTDYFGFDDFLVADRGQIAVTVPEPASTGLVGMALLLVGMAHRRKATARR